MDWAFDINLKLRNLFKGVINRLEVDQLNKIPKGFNNNIIWNIGHIIVTQQILIYQFSGVKPLVEQDFMDTYRKGTTPGEILASSEIQIIRTLLEDTIRQTRYDYENGIFKTYTSYTTSTKSQLTSVDKAIEFNNSHEGIHLGYILALQKLI